MNLMSECISSGSAVRTMCDMKKEATPETLCTLNYCCYPCADNYKHYSQTNIGIIFSLISSKTNKM